MIKRIAVLAALLTVFSTIPASADGRSEEILARVSSKLKSYGTYNVTFRVFIDGMAPLDGNYTVSGSSYSIIMGDIRQLSDGKVRWTVNSDYGEVIVDKVDVNNRSAFSDPTRAFEFAPAEFQSSYVGEGTHGGKTCEVMKLSPRTPQYGGGMVTLYVEKSTSLPVRLVYDYEGQEMDVDVISVTKLSSVDPRIFTFSIDDYPGFEVIDFR